MSDKKSQGGVEVAGGKDKLKYIYRYLVSCHNPPEPVPTRKALQCPLLQPFLFPHLCCKVTRRAKKSDFFTLFLCHTSTSEEFLAGFVGLVFSAAGRGEQGAET